MLIILYIIICIVQYVSIRLYYKYNNMEYTLADRVLAILVALVPMLIINIYIAISIVKIVEYIFTKIFNINWGRTVSW